MSGTRLPITRVFDALALNAPQCADSATARRAEGHRRVDPVAPVALSALPGT